MVIGVIFSLMAAFVLVKMNRFTTQERTVHLIAEGQPIHSANAAENYSSEAVLQTADSAAANDNSAEWMTFGKIDLLAANVGITFTMRCEDGTQVEIPPIDIITWYPEVFEEGEFGIGKRLAVAWEHLGYEGLWIHSGWDFWQERSPATDLQYFLETNNLNEVQSLEVIGEKLSGCLLGSSVAVYQEGTIQDALVAAAVRIPAGEVDELSRHTMDLVPYLASAYPDSGFSELDPDAMLLYFCGRAAIDELTDPDAEYWTQTRFVIAISPLP